MIFVSNVFVYCQDDTVLNDLITIRQRTTQGAHLVVMEPYPKWYWEFVFDGMRLCPRSPERMSALMAKAGWVPKTGAKVSLFQIFGKPLFLVAYCIIAM